MRSTQLNTPPLQSLEAQLAQVTEELHHARHSIHSILNAFGQGFLMFDKDGVCSPVYSNACVTLLETVPTGKHVADILKLDAEQKSLLNMLLTIAFKGDVALPLEEVLQLAPKNYVHSKGLSVDISYKAVLDPKGYLDSIVLIATDISDEVKAKKEHEEQQNIYASIERILHDRSSFGSLMHQLSDLLILLGSGNRELDIIALDREVHTIKGGTGMFKLGKLTQILHELESAVKDYTSAKEKPSITLRKALEPYYPALKNEVASITLFFNDLLGIDIVKLESEKSFDKSVIYGFADYLASQKLVDLRQEYISRVCTESIITHFKRYDYLLQDLAKNFAKQVNPIVFTGADIPFIPENYQGMMESLVHIFLNVVDHGIETVEDRMSKGKSAAGNLEIALSLEKDSHQKPWLHIEIKDDGKGINPAIIRSKLKTKMPGRDWDRVSDEEVIQQIFAPGFSTLDAVTQYSGRGVGMDAVHEEITLLGGTIAVQSKLGSGTVFTIRVPYILDIPGK